MPITAKLSRNFYEKLGDDVANELVEWFNAVDASYRADLRELNDFNFARFDAKQEQRFAEFDAKMDRRFAEFEVKWERRFAEFEVKWDRRFTELRAEFRIEMQAMRAELIKWMFVFWAPTAIAVIALYLKR
jgi:CRP-like cAMP-binding protein